jgi:hypothetical protein
MVMGVEEKTSDVRRSAFDAIDERAQGPRRIRKDGVAFAEQA